MNNLMHAECMKPSDLCMEKKFRNAWGKYKEK